MEQELIIAEDIDKIITWINESISERGYEITYRDLRDEQEILDFPMSDTVRNYLMQYFCVLLEEPVPPV